MPIEDLRDDYADSLFSNLVEGNAVASGDRWLALATDGSYTEAAGGSYARIDVSTVWGTPTAGDGASDTPISFTGLLADTYSHWMLCDDQTASAASSYIARGSLPFAQAVTGGGSVDIAAGDLTATVDPAP